MDNLIDRQAAIDALTEYGNGRAVFISVGEAVIRIEQLPPANNSEIPNSSDTISRAKAIEALRDYLVGKNVPCDGTLTCRLIENEVINKLPTAQLAPSQVAADIARIVENGKDMKVIEAAQPTPDQNGDLWINVPDIDKVTCIYVQESKSKFCRIFYEEQEQSEPYKVVTT